MRIIYDLGANNGDDLGYYLKKADLVVAVEANPALCLLIRERYAAEIAAGALRVENCVITAAASPEPTCRFHLHRNDHVLSQLPAPPPARAAEFDVVELPQMQVIDLVARHGPPYYVKSDIEHYDAEILRALFAHDIRPPYLSAESHDVAVFALMVADGRYDAFKLVDGATVSRRFASHPIAVAGGVATHTFPYHSAGPFGEDIPGAWMDAESFLRLLALEGLGWKDIHATNLVAGQQVAVRLMDYIPASLMSKVRSLFGR